MDEYCRGAGARVVGDIKEGYSCAVRKMKSYCQGRINWIMDKYFSIK